MEWGRPIAASEIRYRWFQAANISSPFNGWPLTLEDRIVELPSAAFSLREAVSALAVVSGRLEFWEAQAHVIAFCSLTDGEPARQWDAIGELEPTGTAWQRGDGLATYLASAEVAVPPFALVASARVVSTAIADRGLNGAAYLVGQMTGPTWDECWETCGNNPACLHSCLVGE